MGDALVSNCAKTDRASCFFRSRRSGRAYLRLSGLPLPEHARAAAKRFRYHQRIFVAPLWPEIFAQDEERKQTLEEAERTHHALVGVYRELGYELVPLPLATVEERMRFVLIEAGLG